MAAQSLQVVFPPTVPAAPSLAGDVSPLVLVTASHRD